MPSPHLPPAAAIAGLAPCLSRRLSLAAADADERVPLVDAGYEALPGRTSRPAERRTSSAVASAPARASSISRSRRRRISGRSSRGMVSTTWRCATGASTFSRSHSAHSSCFFFSQDGQKLRPRQEKATSTLLRHCEHHSLAKPCASRPHLARSSGWASGESRFVEGVANLGFPMMLPSPLRQSRAVRGGPARCRARSRPCVPWRCRPRRSRADGPRSGPTAARLPSS